MSELLDNEVLDVGLKAQLKVLNVFKNAGILTIRDKKDLDEIISELEKQQELLTESLDIEEALVRFYTFPETTPLRYMYLNSVMEKGKALNKYATELARRESSGNYEFKKSVKVTQIVRVLFSKVGSQMS